MKIVVVNSIGPMASTVVGSILEKFGYLNIPVRKLGLHEYLIGFRKIDDDFLIKRFEKIIESHSKMITSGGVNVFDRNAAPPRSLIDKNLITDDIAKLKRRKFNNISDLYNYVRITYAKALQYKKSYHSDGKHVEYTTDIFKFQPGELLAAYKSEFKHVVMINLHRDFPSWLDSLVSQRFVHPDFKTRFLFFFHSAFDLFKVYEKKINQYPGLHLEFDSLFIPHNKGTYKKIADILEEPLPDIQWENEIYDLYGKLSDYKTTFTKADVKGCYLSTVTHKAVKSFIKRERITIWHDLVVFILYLTDMIRFYMKKRSRTKRCRSDI